ncbi:hypothetical protein F4604DRAFT_1818513 [Suillus subluteus]|nr:hypothetical protein F4604DRAFT_1818513 [Suillus subluteus]
MLIPPAFDLLHFIPSSLLNHGKLARAERIVSRTLLYIHVLTYAPPLSAMLSSPLPPVSNAYHRSARERMAHSIRSRTCAFHCCGNHLGKTS